MKRWMQRGAAFGLALLMTAGAAGASASDALGWEIHTGRVPLSQGTELGKNIFWSDTYSDLRTEHYITYAPNENVTPTVAYGSKVLTRATLTSMAQGLESQGKRVVSGINGDFYVLATGAPVGLLVTDGVLRSTQPYNVSWAIGFRADGTAFIGTPNVSVAAVLGGQAYSVSGGVNKVRKPSASDGSGGLTLLTSDFASTTQNTEAGVDVILSPAADPVTGQVPQLKIGSQLTCTVEQVLESTGATAIPEGKLVLTLNGKDKAELLAALRALQAGDTVTLSATSPDSRWDSVTQAVGGMYKLVTGGVVESGLNAEQTARSAVGIRADGSLVFYTVDGKQSGYSVGATLTQCAKRLVELGCVEAVCLDGGPVAVDTGIGFFDHMLEAFAVHGGLGLTLKAEGDLRVDGHHTVEDTGIVLGKALADALGNKEGTARFGSFTLPMDEALAFAAVDISGRPYLVFEAAFAQERIGDYDSCLTGEFFRAMAFNAGITLHLRALYGDNAHHVTEALFKAAAHALRLAVVPRDGILSTKGSLD